MVSIIDVSNQDWYEFIKENNLTTEDVDFYLNNILDTSKFDEIAGDVVDIKSDIYIKRKSGIHGFGIFAKKDVNKNDIIGTVLGFKNGEKYRSYNDVIGIASSSGEKKYRTYIGRFTNHSNLKNVIFKELDSGNVIAICIKNIKEGEEILVDYRDHFLKW